MTSFRPARLSPALTVLAVAGIAAAIVGARELAYWGGAADTPSFLRMYFQGYQKDYASPVGRVNLQGPAVDRLDAAIGKAYWSNPGLVPKLEQFEIDAHKFFRTIYENLGERVGSYRETRDTVRKLLEARADHFARLSSLMREVKLSSSDPSKDATNLTSDERKLLEVERSIVAALIAADADQRLEAQRGAAQRRFRELEDVYANPAVSTATLQLAVDEGFTPPIAKTTEMLRAALLQIVRARDLEEVDKIRREKILSLRQNGCRSWLLYDCDRDNAMFATGKKVAQTGAGSDPDLQRAMRRVGDDAANRLADAYLDPSVTTLSWYDAESVLYRTKRTALEARAR